MKFDNSSGSASCEAVSRRSFLNSAATFAVACGVFPSLEGFTVATKRRRTFAYVGTDTKPVDGTANGKGIYLFEMDSASGELTPIKLAAESANPTWLTVHPSGRYLYASNEISNFQGSSGSVSAFAIDRKHGDLRFLNSVSSQGASPAYLSLDASGKYAFVANYFGGSIAVLPVLSDGSLGEAVDVHRDTGHLENIHSMDAAAGSFAISGHDGPHPHMIHPDPANRFVLQTDLGQDRIYVYKCDGRTGKLSPANSPFVTLPSGDGPRHFVFHPTKAWMYSIQEEASTVAFFHYEPTTGSLTTRQTISTLPKGFTGTNFCSEIMLSPDARFLYAANRLHNSIAVFAIGLQGNLKRIGEASTQGDYPSQFSLDPSGMFLYACNQRSDQITSFRVDKKTGLLMFTGQYTPVGTPLCITFLT